MQEKTRTWRDVPPPKIALVLGGGGARGFAHIGVIRVLDQEKIPINLVVGASVGSLIGAMYASHPDVFELEWKAFTLKEDDLLDYAWLSARRGLVKGDAIVDFVRTNVRYRNIEQFPIPFIAVATDINTGERVDIDAGDVAMAVRASVSIPGVFVPLAWNGRNLVDGGVVDNIPVDVARERGADIVIASSIAEDTVESEVTDVVDVVVQAINIMMGRMARYQVKDADVVIAPEVGDIGTLEFGHKKHCMEEGIRAARERVPAIRGAMAEYYRNLGVEPPPAFVESDSHLPVRDGRNDNEGTGTGARTRAPSASPSPPAESSPTLENR